MNGVKKYFRQLKWEKIVTAIIAIVLGAIFIANPDGALNFVCKAAGVAMLVIGAIFLIKYFSEKMYFFENFVKGCMIVLAGLLFLLRTGSIVTVIALFFGMFLVLDGLSKVREASECKKANLQGWYVPLILAAVTVTLGVLTAFLTADWVMILLGVSMIVDGACDLVATVWFDANIRKLKKSEEEEVEKDFGEMDEVE